MSKIVFFTDSCSDITCEEAKKLGIKVLPVYYYFDNENIEYGDEVNITMREFFDKIEKGGKPNTASCNIDVIYNNFKKEVEQGNEIICVNISSKLSSCYNNCLIAADMVKEEYENAKIHVVDSLSGSLGQGLMIHNLLNQKNSFEEITKEIEEEKNKYHIEFFVDDLSYLVRGGRLSKTGGFIGKTLNIKPLIGVNAEGKAVSILKVKGEKKTINTLIDRMVNNIGDNEIIGVVHSNALDKAKILKEKIEELKIAKEIILSEITPTIASHIGPDAVGLAYKLKKPKQIDLK